MQCLDNSKEATPPMIIRSSEQRPLVHPGQVKIGDKIRHSNTHQWGVVLEIAPQLDRTIEFRVRGILDDTHTDERAWGGERWWSSRHLHSRYSPHAEGSP